MIPPDAAGTTCGGPAEAAVRGPVDKQILALDALSKLTRQFCDKPDFERLIEILMMTLCGQFSVADVFALFERPSSHSLNQSYFATGRYRKSVMLASLQVETAEWPDTPGIRSVQQVTELRRCSEPAALVPVLAEVGVALVCPLIHNDRFFGIIGLGDRVTGRPYGAEDIELLNAIINTVTPLVANSYLFWDIASLNAWYLDILNNVKQGVFVFGEDFRLKKINWAGLRILKEFRPDDVELVDLENADIEHVFPSAVFDGWAQQFTSARSGRKGAATNSVVARSAGNERIYNVSITGSVEHNEMGTALIITLDDVTVQKESEQRLFDLQKFADKGLMASSIAHELNNFLALILGGVEIVEVALDNVDKEKVRDTIYKLKENVTNMERFTRGLMDLSRLESVKEPLNLSTVVGDVLAFVSVQKRFKNIVISPDLDPELPEIEMDRDQIAQLLLNLLNNAADAIEKAGRECGRIGIETKAATDHIVLAVSDNGTGISPDVKEKLFESSFTTKQKGHGYGLVTCAWIVRDNNGSITADSVPGEGTAFTIRFPRFPGALPQSP